MHYADISSIEVEQEKKKQFWQFKMFGYYYIKYHNYVVVTILWQDESVKCRLLVIRSNKTIFTILDDIAVLI